MQTNLNRKLGIWATISIVAGSVIGSSIFMKPAVMAAQLGSPLLLLAVWIGAGIISLMGASINAEIGAMLPVTGGQYVFFEKMYGKFFAFIYGWASFAVINTASIAAIAYIFSDYAGYFISLPRFSQPIEHSIHLTIPLIGHFYPLENIGVKGLAIVIVLLLTFLNSRSVKGGSVLQVFFSAVKVIALIFLIAMIFFSGKGNVHNFTTNSSSFHLSGWQMAAAIITAMSGAFAAYDGWNNIGFVAGEIKNPKKNIPRGLFIGLSICMLLYIGTNQAYLYMLPIDDMSKSTLVAMDALQPIAGNSGMLIIALLVMTSTFGATNGNILSCSRVTFEMAQQGNFFKSIGSVHKKYHTPANALWLHAGWICLFVLTGSFDMLTDLFVFTTWIFYGFGAAGIFILRKKMADTERPYKTWGYPITPILFISFSAFYFGMTMYTDVNNYLLGKTNVIYSMYGLLLTLMGVPIYFYLRKNKNSNSIDNKLVNDVS